MEATIHVETCVGVPPMKPKGKRCPVAGQDVPALVTGKKLSATCSLCNAAFVGEIE